MSTTMRAMLRQDHGGAALPEPDGARQRNAAAAYHEPLALAHAAALDFLASLPTRPAAVEHTGDVGPVPDGIGFGPALAHFLARYEPRLSASPGPRYFGYVTGGATPAALAADWLVGAYDQNVSNDAGSVAAAIERATARRLAELFGLGDHHSGHFVTGATQANTVALATAREWAGERLGTDVAREGVAAIGRLPVLAGMAHSSVGKALSVLGLGRDALQPVRCLPGRTAVDVAAMDEALTALRGAPAVVVASAGEVNTGDFDDIAALAALCRRHGAWLHVDGAFGLFAAFDPDLAPRLEGIAQADSVTVDMHKWLNLPYDSALVYTRHPALQRRVYRASAAYLGDSEDPLHYTPENSRRFRALPAWFALAADGQACIADAVRRSCTLARRLGAGITALPGLELVDDVRLNIVCFAATDTDPQAGPAARDALLRALTADGRSFMTPTTLFGRPAVRAAVSGWATDIDDIDATLDALRTALHQAVPAAANVVG